jgi:DNA-binding GntR family transcriptional regulator
MVLETPIKRKSLQKMVYETVREAILEREIEPGDSINIKRLAEKLGVSNIPVREALRHLEAEGMVNFTSNKRILVSQLSCEDLYDIYSLRIPLEEMALLKCLERIEAGDLHRLESLHKQMSKNGVLGNKWFNLNRSFHMILHESSGSSRLFQILQSLWNSTGPYLRVFSESKSAVDRANLEHARILESLKKSDRSLAKKAIKAHLRNGLKVIEANLKEQQTGGR